MTTIYDINTFLKEVLDPHGIPDSAINGIQVETDADIAKAAFAVDASTEALHHAVDFGCNLLVVHHGLFWGQALPIVGNLRKRLSLMLKNNIGLIAYHLPLDAHIDYGNNSQILRAIVSAPLEPFGKYKGNFIGFMTTTEKPLLREKVMQMLGMQHAQWPHVLLPFGPAHIRTIAAVSGSGAQIIEEAIEKKVDLFITGDASHQIYHTAKEAGINVLSAGHYFTETFGIRALMKPVKEKFNIETLFIDIPTGL